MVWHPPGKSVAGAAGVLPLNEPECLKTDTAAAHVTAAAFRVAKQGALRVFGAHVFAFLDQLRAGGGVFVNVIEQFHGHYFG